MKVSVQGVTIELTKTQIAQIEKEKAARVKECRSFESVLKSFGFKKMNTTGWVDPDQNCWEHKNGWIANIINYGRYHQVFITGPRIYERSYPYGTACGTPEDLMNVLINAKEDIENTPIK